MGMSRAEAAAFRRLQEMVIDLAAEVVVLAERAWPAEEPKRRPGRPRKDEALHLNA
jgi:hypothetical protein